MEDKEELAGLLKDLPPVEFCCTYGSSLHPNKKKDEDTMIDFIIGVSDPKEWHTKNFNMNRDHYGGLLMHVGGPALMTQVAEELGVGVFFNPFVNWNDRLIKYGVVRMHHLVQDVLDWKSFYLSGRLQKPVQILADNLDIRNVNSYNLKAATSAALLLLPTEFSEEDLYAKICSLSYMGDLRMLFAEDKTKVKRIVEGQFELFRKMYKPHLDEYASKELLRLSSSSGHQINITQDCGLPATRSLVSYLPSSVRTDMGMKLGEKRKLSESGRVIREVLVDSRGSTAECMRKILRNKVMVSSFRQAAAGLLAAGPINSSFYLARKVEKAWNSWRR